MDYRVFPPEEMFEATVLLPRSKSISNRALIMHALTPGNVPAPIKADCADSDAIVKALADTASGADSVNIGAAGTAMRFLTAYYSAIPGVSVTLDGSERMRHRPIGPLVDALRECGACIDYAGEEGFPPLRITGTRLQGGEVTLPANISSQFISALMMVAPTMTDGLRINLEGEIISLPYIKMTQAMMENRGIEVERYPQVIDIESGTYEATTDTDEVERDWSAASYWAEISAISAGFVTLPGLKVDGSLQGDSAAMEIFERMGVICQESEDVDDAAEFSPSPEVYSRIDLDMTETPDLAQTVAVTAAMLGLPFCLKGLSSLRIKETDRIAALCDELLKFGFVLEAEGDHTLRWEGRRMPITELPVVETYDDHRMAMAFAPTALFVPGVVIRNIDVVKKSYPGYWDDLRSAGFRLVDAADPLADG